MAGNTNPEITTRRWARANAPTVRPERTLPTRPQVDSGLIHGPVGTPVQRTVFHDGSGHERKPSMERSKALHGQDRHEYIERLAAEKRTRET